MKTDRELFELKARLNSKNIPFLNKISITIYHFTFVIAMQLFLIALIPIRLIFMWVTPREIWINLMDKVKELVDKKLAQLESDFNRLSKNKCNKSEKS